MVGGVGTDTKFFPIETWWGGGWRSRKKMTQRKGNQEKEAEEENIKVLSFTRGRPWPT